MVIRLNQVACIWRQSTEDPAGAWTYFSHLSEWRTWQAEGLGLGTRSFELLNLGERGFHGKVFLRMKLIKTHLQVK